MEIWTDSSLSIDEDERGPKRGSKREDFGGIRRWGSAKKKKKERRVNRGKGEKEGEFLRGFARVISR